MRGLIDDLVGAIYDWIKCLFRSFAYFMAGVLIVSAMFYLFVWLVKSCTSLFA